MNQQEEKREASLLNLFIHRDALSLLTFNKRLMREKRVDSTFPPIRWRMRVTVGVAKLGGDHFTAVNSGERHGGSIKDR